MGGSGGGTFFQRFSRDPQNELGRKPLPSKNRYIEAMFLEAAAQIPHEIAIGSHVAQGEQGLRGRAWLMGAHQGPPGLSRACLAGSEPPSCK